MQNKVFVGSLPFSTTEEELKEAFSKVGEVESANIIQDRETGRSRGFGFVEFKTDEAAQAAIEEFNEKEFNGRKIFVNIARPREDR
ncbi:MAG TPA: RNA-binding protein [Patescibacteria group bacterium]|nr:RNA-binding protein [Patescibacteria group bacterium]